jgi:septal ring factor EnvC (AmiA/AmiB activator)
MADEEIRSEVTPIRRGSPLPWLLLAVTLSVMVGIFAMARSRLNEERLRTANALKANDEVMGRLRAVTSDFAKSEITIAELETKRAMLERQINELAEKARSLSADLQEARRKGSKK